MPNTIFRSADGATLLAGSVKDYGQIVASASAETDTTSVKVCVECTALRTLGVDPFASLLLKRLVSGSSDGVGFMYTAADPNGTLSKPFGDDTDDSDNPTGAVTAADDSSGGSWGSTGAKGVRVTAVNGTGQTVGSVEKTFNVGDVARRWRYDWTSLNAFGATGYKVYVTDTPGDYSAARMQVVSGGSTTFLVDDGSAGTPTAIPSTNTSGGAGPTYGTAPSIVSHTSADKTIATDPTGLRPGEQWFFWLMVKLPAGTTGVLNPRSARIKPTEV